MCSDQTAEGTMLPLISNLVVITNESFFIRSGSHFVGCHGNLDVNIKSAVHFFTLCTMLYAIAKKYLHIFKQEKKSSLPVWYLKNH